MGSEMCIRDRSCSHSIFMSRECLEPTEGNRVYITLHQKPENVPCLSSGCARLHCTEDGARRPNCQQPPIHEDIGRHRPRAKSSMLLKDFPVLKHSTPRRREQLFMPMV